MSDSGTSAAVRNLDVDGLAVKGGLFNEHAPFIFENASSGGDFFSWLQRNHETVEQEFRAYGAVLFRGFSLASHESFDRLLQVMCTKVIAGYGDLPPEKGTDRVYGSTPYPADRSILFHSESSHMPSWPTRQFFACVIAAQTGGETPLVDCRQVFQQLAPLVREKFREKGLRYVRNFIDGFDVSWQSFFKTDDKNEVRQICARRGAEHSWASDGTLKLVQPSQAVARHPVTGELSFFNQIMLHHPHFLPAEDREALKLVFGVERMPRLVTYGDGTPIEPSVLDQVAHLYQAGTIAFPWKEGDVLMVDNMAMAHARKPFTGPRKIIVGMGDPIEMFNA